MAGTFMDDENQPLITMRLDFPPGFRNKVIYHEYIHYLSQLDQVNRPLWWQEGIAELYSTVEFTKDRLVFGRWDNNHVRVLQTDGLIPLQQFFTADQQFIHKGNRIYRYYAQAWTFLHYCLLGEGRKYSESYNEFVDRLGLGAEIDPAYKASFKIDYKQLTRDLRRHISGGSAYVTTLELRDLDIGEIQEMGTPSAAQLDFALGNLLYQSHRVDDALPYLIRANQTAPDWPRPYETLGHIAIYKADEDLAESYFLEAEEHDSTNVQIYHALASLRSVESGGDKINSISLMDPDFLKREIYSRLRRAIRLNPFYFKSYELLLDICIHSDKKIGPNTLEFLRQGRWIRPRDFDYASKIALLEIHSKNTQKVRDALAPFLDLKAGKSLREQALVLLKYSGLEPPVVFTDISKEDFADAEAKIGQLLMKGLLPSYEQAVGWFRKSAESGSLLGQTVLGMSYFRGQGVPQDSVRGLELVRSAAGQDFIRAQRVLGKIYYSGKVIDQDYGEALLWLKKAADQEDAEAQNLYAWMLATCPQTEIRNGAEAVVYAKKAVAQNENAVILDTLAAAYAESGDFRRAVNTQKKVITRLDQGTFNRDEILERLELYKNRKPWREEPDASDLSNSQ